MDEPTRNVAYRVLTITVHCHVLGSALAFLADHAEVYEDRTEEVSIVGSELLDGSYPVLDEQAIANFLAYFPLLKKYTPLCNVSLAG